MMSYSQYRSTRALRGRLLIEELESRNLLSITAQSFTLNALENTTRIINLAPRAADSDPNATLIFSLVSATSSGGGKVAVANSLAGTVDYTPPSLLSPFQDSFQYSVADSVGSAPVQATVTVNVASIAANPVLIGELEGQQSIPVTVAALAGAVQDVSVNPRYVFSNLAVANGGAGAVGGFTNSATGAFTYSPPSSSFTGVVDLSYQVTDATTNEVVKSIVALDIEPIVANPVAWNDLLGQPTNVPALAASIQDVSSATTFTFSNFTVQGGSGDGSVTTSDPTTGSFTYKPPASPKPGVIHVRYTVGDKAGNTAVGDVAINVGPIVADPVVWDALEGGSTKVPPLADSIQDVSPAANYTFSAPTVVGGQGSISGFDSSTGAFNYTPPSSTFTGPVFVHYTVSDGVSATSGTVTINVSPLVASPVVWSDLEGQQTSIPSLVGSMQDVSSAAKFTFSGPTVDSGEGSISNFNSTTGTFNYLPPSSTYTGPAHVHYTVGDGHASAHGVVTINVSPLVADTVLWSDLQSRTTRVSGVLGSIQDISSSTAFTFSDPSVVGGPGVIANYNTTTGAFTYTPDPSFTGVVKVYYHVKDGMGDSTTGIVSINIAKAIVVQPDGPFTAVLGQPITIPAWQLVSNDIAPNGATPRIKSVQDALNGRVVLNPDGSITFTPTTVGAAGFSYTDSDAAGDLSTSATVSFLVSPPPPPGLTVRIHPIGARVKHKMGGTIAHLYTTLAKAKPNTYHAVVNWGDGVLQAARIVKAGAHAFKVDASHKYALKGVYTARLTITDAGGDTLTEPFMVDIH